MTGYSDGRWEVEEVAGGRDGTFLYVWLGRKDLGATRRVIVSHPVRAGDRPDGTDRANARLIEQAPAMLEVLLVQARLAKTDAELGDVCRRLGGDWLDAWIIGGRVGVLRVCGSRAAASIGRVTGEGV